MTIRIGAKKGYKKKEKYSKLLNKNTGRNFDEFCQIKISTNLEGITSIFPQYGVRSIAHNAPKGMISIEVDRIVCCELAIQRSLLSIFNRKDTNGKPTAS